MCVRDNTVLTSACTLLTSLHCCVREGGRGCQNEALSFYRCELVQYLLGQLLDQGHCDLEQELNCSRAKFLSTKC